MHWAFSPVVRPELPTVHGAAWIRRPLDHFVLRHLEERGVAPTTGADRYTLIRRLSLDLLGLLPSPEQVRSFVTDTRPAAYEHLVDTLLASAHFGERWGRHWLDLARYADSDGYENDKPRPNAWKYRDWVIDAFNRDLPYDRFTLEQLAGDLLPQPSPAQRTAAGLHRNTLTHTGAGSDKEEFRTIAIKDRVESTGTMWLGLTLRCAQCHSHKYDPVSHHEYYQLYAFFNNTDDEDLEVDGEKIRTLRVARRDTFVHEGGDFRSRGEAATPATPAFLPALATRGEAPDRLDLAHWLVGAQQPLTARVAVNRVWQHLFGVGLVPTPENFGVRGKPPTHPELLDWLASEYVRIGWSRKALIRSIVCSATYRQASVQQPRLPASDHDNAGLERQNRFRVEAEIVRDVALQVSGLLNTRLGGASIQPPLPTSLKTFGELKKERFMEARGERHRRGVYVHVQRTFVYPMLSAFDAPSGNEPCPLRERTDTPMQALTLSNDPVFVECARALGHRLRNTETSSPPGTAREGTVREKLHFGFELCLGRTPGAKELRVLESLFEEQRAIFSRDLEAARRASGPDAPADNETADRAAWVEVAAALLNVDEFISRE